MTKLLLQWEL